MKSLLYILMIPLVLCACRIDDVDAPDSTFEGRLVDALHGTGGFGYDPLFIPEGHERTFAELGDQIKNTLSHRSQALMQVVEFLKQAK